MEVTRNIWWILLLAFCINSCKQDAMNPTIEEDTQQLVITPEISVLSEKIAQDIANPELRFKRAEALYAEGLYEQATEDLRVAIKSDSLQPHYYHLLSDVFMDNNNSSKALQTIKVAAGLFPERTQTLLKLSETHFILTQYEESIGRLNSILAYDPNNAEVYFMLGQNFRELGDEERALNAYQTATELDAKIIDAWLAIGTILEKRGNDRAEKYYITATSVDPNNVYALHNLAFYYQSKNEINKAIEYYDKIIEVDKNYSAAYLNKGLLYLERGNVEKANEHLLIYNLQQKLDPKGYFYLGYIADLKGDKSAALAFLESALNLDPSYEKAKSLLEKLKS